MAQFMRDNMDQFQEIGTGLTKIIPTDGEFLRRHIDVPVSRFCIVWYSYFVSLPCFSLYTCQPPRAKRVCMDTHTLNPVTARINRAIGNQSEYRILRIIIRSRNIPFSGEAVMPIFYCLSCSIGIGKSAHFNRISNRQIPSTIFRDIDRSNSTSGSLRMEKDKGNQCKHHHADDPHPMVDRTHGPSSIRTESAIRSKKASMLAMSACPDTPVGNISSP